MTLTSHAVVGAMLAARISDPVVLGVSGVALHYLGDVLPHWDFGTHIRKKSSLRLWIESFLDVVVGWGLAFLLYFFLFGGTSFFWLAFGVLASQLPDWINAPYLFLKWHFAPFTWWHRLGSYLNTELDKPWGIVTQVVALFLLYIVLFEVL